MSTLIYPVSIFDHIVNPKTLEQRQQAAMELTKLKNIENIKLVDWYDQVNPYAPNRQSVILKIFRGAQRLSWNVFQDPMVQVVVDQGYFLTPKEHSGILVDLLINPYAFNELVIDQIVKFTLKHELQQEGSNVNNRVKFELQQSPIGLKVARIGVEVGYSPLNWINEFTQESFKKELQALDKSRKNFNTLMQIMREIENG